MSPSEDHGRSEFWAEYELSQEQRDYVTRHLHSSVKTVNCDWCGENAWGVEPNLVQLKIFTRGVEIRGAPVYPMVLVRCGNCGHTIFFNALSIGLTIRESDESV